MAMAKYSTIPIIFSRKLTNIYDPDFIFLKKIHRLKKDSSKKFGNLNKIKNFDCTLNFLNFFVLDRS